MKVNALNLLKQNIKKNFIKGIRNAVNAIFSRLQRRVGRVIEQQSRDCKIESWPQKALDVSAEVCAHSTTKI